VVSEILSEKMKYFSEGDDKTAPEGTCRCCVYLQKDTSFLELVYQDSSIENRVTLLQHWRKFKKESRQFSLVLYSNEREHRCEQHCATCCFLSL